MPASPPGTSPRPSLGNRLFVATIVIGVLLPWAVGAVEKVYLDHLGKPTYDWLFFLDPRRLPAELALSGVFAAPFILYGWLARWVLGSPHLQSLGDTDRRWLVLPGFALGIAAYIWNSWRVFTVFDPLLFFFPRYVIGIGVGVALGTAVVIARRWTRGTHTPARGPGG